MFSHRAKHFMRCVAPLYDIRQSGEIAESYRIQKSFYRITAHNAKEISTPAADKKMPAMHPRITGKQGKGSSKRRFAACRRD
jgi:hypothetical protein